MSRVPNVTRRTLLRGVGAAALGLPPLEIMLRGRTAQGAVGAPPMRFCMSWIGNALSSDGNGALEGTTPKSTGTGWAVPRSLKGLADFGIANYVSVVSGLTIPWNVNPPPGGKGLLVHFNTMGPQIAGTRGGAGALGTSNPKGPTADQIVADIIAPGMLTPTLAYRMQAYGYVGGDGGNGRQSYRTDKGALVGIDPFASPKLAYQSMFSGASTPNATPADIAKTSMLLRQKKSILDLVIGDLNSIRNKLGAADQIRVQRHADQVRDLELRLDKMDPAVAQPGVAQPVGAKCKKPADPGADPARTAGYAYSGEEQRADVFSDLIALAFACDQSRVASYMITHMKCWMGLPPNFPYPRNLPDIHQMSHEGSGMAYIDAIQYLVTQWGKMLKKIHDITEVDGSNVLDHTAAVLVFEAGHGYDSETGGSDHAHSTENMAILIAGGAGGLKKGTHVKATGKHPANAVITAMNAVGFKGTTMGEVTGNIPELLP